MSDSEIVETKKRGRPTLGEKRARPPTPPRRDKEEKSSSVHCEIPVKRGRGRPKGSTKKNGGKKQLTNKNTSKIRGKPVKKKDDSTEEENEENDETEENDDELEESGSDE